MKTVLITGGAGFIGSHLCERFLLEGFRVVSIDNLCTGDIENIEPLIANDNFLFFEMDVSGKINLPNPIIDYILHFASPASPFDYARLPVETMRANSIGTLNVLEIARRNNARIVVASTSEIYGDPLEHPQKESYWGNANSYGERSCYDESKRFMEAAVYTYQKIYNTNAGIVRIFNTFGERMKIDDGRAIPQFFSQAIKNEPITIFGDGEQTRSFCYVDDLVDGVLKLLFSDYQLPVNIGNPDEITLNQLAKEIIEITGSSSEIVYKDLPKDDPKQRKPDIALAKEVLHWKPSISRYEGLKKTYQYFKEKLL
jgi:dTDP-glucose 4,6-dehydratase